MKTSLRNYLLVFIGALAVAFVARTLWFYHWVYVGPGVPESTPQSIGRLSEKYDTVTGVVGQGQLVLIDTGHSNDFSEDEITLFTGRLAATGAQVEFSSEPFSRLSEAVALVVMVPSSPFTTDELLAIQQFVDKGGRLVLIGDPTRERNVEALNSLAGAFGVIYQEDYIYNLQENDGSFRNVIFKDFAPDLPLTEGLSRVVFQTAHALRVAEDSGLIFGDENTYSSGNEQPGGVIAAALTGDGKVLSLPDMTFLTSPYNTFADNDHLIDNIVTFALSAERLYDLADFPYYFPDPIQIVYENSQTLNNTFADSVNLRARLTSAGTPSELAEEFSQEKPSIYLAVYDDAGEDVIALLKKEGITFEEGQIVVKDTATLEQSGTVLLHLVRPAQPSERASGGQGPAASPPYHLIILADSEDDLSTGVSLLLSGGLSACRITSLTAICQTGEVSTAPGPFPTPSPGGAGGNFVVVADDLSTGSPDLTSAPRIADTLIGLGYQATLVSTTANGIPSAADLSAYDAVFWSTGDGSISDEGTQALMDYLDQGGKLLIDGGAIAFFLSGSDFLESYLKAGYVSYGNQVDLEVGPGMHPLTLDFGGAVIPFAQAPGASPDVIEPRGDAQVIFVRGPDSEMAGSAAMVAYESGSRRVAYAAFPLYALSDGDLMLLISNAVAWFSTP